MNEFCFVGRIPSSKSLLNRALIIQSYFPPLEVAGHSDAQDVVKMREALSNFGQGHAYDCGAAGTVLRFLALRLSRVRGSYLLTGTERLMERPQQELLTILGQLGCRTDLTRNGLRIESDGWRPYGDMLNVRVDRSSQFLSGVLLNAWELPFDLYVSANGSMVSKGYLDMTIDLCRQAGMRVERSRNEFFIGKRQPVLAGKLHIECDLSSAFALAACAAVAGTITLTDFPETSLQPDAIFVPLLDKMGVPMVREHGQLKVRHSQGLRGVEADLVDSPDLFPVLAVLCALAEGPSQIRGASHLHFKESNRIAKTHELLTRLRPAAVARDDGMDFPAEKPVSPAQAGSWSFDPDHDHRMAMAAAVLHKAGYQVECRDRGVVDKSFPEFWSILQEPR